MATQTSFLRSVFEELVHTRHSVRSFQNRAVEREKIEAVIEAANAAPSAGGLQAYQMVCITRGKDRQALAQAAPGQEFVGQAPVVLVFLADPGRSAARFGDRGSRLYSIQDATIACAYAQLRAHDLGLGTTWVGAFEESSVARVLGENGDLVPVALLPMGYPDEFPLPTPRRGPEGLVRYLWDDVRPLWDP